MKEINIVTTSAVLLGLFERYPGQCDILQGRYLNKSDPSTVLSMLELIRGGNTNDIHGLLDSLSEYSLNIDCLKGLLKQSSKDIPPFMDEPYDRTGDPSTKEILKRKSLFYLSPLPLRREENPDGTFAGKEVSDDEKFKRGGALTVREILTVWTDINDQIIQEYDWGNDWGDISITIETSGNLLFKRISTDHRQREHAATLCLTSVKNNDLTAEGKVMMKLAKGLPVKTHGANSKYVSKIRASLRSYFKIDKDPFCEYDATCGYKPKFILKETTTSQDERERRGATRTTYDNGVQTEQGFEELTETEREAELARLIQEQEDDDGSGC